MKLCIGQVVRDEDFWDRENELNTIWEAVDSGSHVLLAAPRRVGKTSIMFRMQDRAPSGYLVIYVDTESADCENDFWHKLFHALLEEEFVNKAKAHSTKFFQFLKNIRIKKISVSGVEFDDGQVVNYAEAFEMFVRNLDIEYKLIIMIDEFAQTVENIIQYQGQQKAESFLQTHRAMRLNPKVSEKVSFVYAGSIGLESVVAKIGATKFINDLNSIKILPLSMLGATDFAHKFCTDNGITMSDTMIAQLLVRIEWLIPFYIQLILREIKTVLREQRVDVVEANHIDMAIHAAIEHKHFFEPWRSKLKEGLDEKSYLFAKEVLNFICENDTITSAQIANIATKHHLNEETYKETIHSLVYDGYINNNDDPKIYRFNSPILKAWWCKYVAN